MSDKYGFRAYTHHSSIETGMKPLRPLKPLRSIEYYFFTTFGNTGQQFPVSEHITSLVTFN